MNSLREPGRGCLEGKCGLGDWGAVSRGGGEEGGAVGEGVGVVGGV